MKIRTEKKKNIEDSSWKKCPDYVDGCIQYFVDDYNPRIARSKGNGGYGWDIGCCTIIGDIPIPANKVTSLNIEMSYYGNNNRSVNIGVAPFDIDQNGKDNYNKCGWYLNCGDSKLYSGPPHNYRCKEYNTSRWNSKYELRKNIVGVVMDTSKGELSFVLNKVNLGIAYSGIPLNKPLVPCAILHYEGGSVELKFNE